MRKVKLGDVVRKVSDKVDKDTCGLKYYVGGEHFDSGEILITKRGEIAGSTIGPAFHMRFKPGHVLLMSRNPHLRKAGMVDFEGICSDVSYVLETKNKEVLLQEYLPFVLQRDEFWQFASANKKGSTNFFLNWKDFEKYEFDLPSIEEQKKLAKILWAAEELKLKYRKLENLKDILIKQIIFDNLNEKNTCLLGDTVELNYGRSQKNLDSEGPYPIFGTSGILGYTNKFLYERESIIIGRKGTINKPIYVNEPFWAVDTTFYIQKKTNFNIKWLFYYLFYLVDFLSLNQATGVPSLSSNIVKNIKIPLPSIEIQNEIVSICFSIEDVFEKAKNNIDLIDRIIKKIINGGQVDVQ